MAKEALKQTSLRLPPELMKRLKHAAVEADVTVKAIVQTAVARELDDRDAARDADVRTLKGTP